MRAIDVLKLGQSVKDPATAKKYTQITNYIVGVLTSMVVGFNALFPEHAIPDSVIDPSAMILGGLVVVFNIYMNAATSTKIGVSGATK